jgi:hypothetical protein
MGWAGGGERAAGEAAAVVHSPCPPALAAPPPVMRTGTDSWYCGADRIARGSRVEGGGGVSQGAEEQGAGSGRTGQCG